MIINLNMIIDGTKKRNLFSTKNEMLNSNFFLMWQILFSLILPIFIVLKMLSVYIQVHFMLDFIIEANIMNPELTVPLGSGPIFFAIKAT